MIRKPYLDEDSVLAIFALRPRREQPNAYIPCRQVAKQYNVSDKTIREIWNCKSWTKLTRPFWSEMELDRGHPRSLAEGMSEACALGASSDFDGSSSDFDSDHECDEAPNALATNHECSHVPVDMVEGAHVDATSFCWDAPGDILSFDLEWDQDEACSPPLASNASSLDANKRCDDAGCDFVELLDVACEEDNVFLFGVLAEEKPL
eukprot:CAMPEP_0196736314 /NCGR_PEP_ID=MMETSP1091-20130531/14418_1 /TAXON_ID=302021 /ORGANISM="Rhodomonas sp., Strain CCMP768" /LENGTH=205 /DNA_ID=CAMNT_0042080025 /DNA_START=10 /DNA_END=623 /DNA_ORIENTATION=+